jgi:hypothetical protein
MRRTYHWCDFETTLRENGHRISVLVEAELSSGGGTNETTLESVRVKLLDSNVEVVPTDKQMKAIKTEVFERCKI